jgi:protein-S-isoprenylcysteine O-methyltransferase Ste14
MPFTSLVYGWILVAVLTFVVLLRIRAPYGRYASEGRGPSIPHRVGWIAMELVSPVAFLVFFLAGGGLKTGPMWLFAALWSGHYMNRALIYPLRQKTRGKRMPVAIMGSAMLFNGVNGFLNGHYLGAIATPYPVEWLADSRFVVGVSLFAAGVLMNWHADRILLRLRRPGDTGYRVPEGGLYRWVSCPNYLGEMIEWIGFALLTWSLPAVSFAVWTVANLAPRALAHHRWYRERFPDYPPRRKALIPGLL